MQQNSSAKSSKIQQQNPIKSNKIYRNAATKCKQNTAAAKSAIKTANNIAIEAAMQQKQQNPTKTAAKISQDAGKSSKSSKIQQKQ